MGADLALAPPGAATGGACHPGGTSAPLASAREDVAPDTARGHVTPARSRHIGPEPSVPPRTGSRWSRTRRRLAIAYGTGAAVLAIWAVFIGFSLPDRNVARHWNLAWAGLDVMIVLALATTAWRASRHDRRVALPATVTSTLLIVDAWMDVMTASRRDLWESLLLAGAVEIPLAVVSLIVAHREDPR